MAIIAAARSGPIHYTHEADTSADYAAAPDGAVIFNKANGEMVKKKGSNYPGIFDSDGSTSTGGGDNHIVVLIFSGSQTFTLPNAIAEAVRFDVHNGNTYRGWGYNQHVAKNGNNATFTGLIAGDIITLWYRGTGPVAAPTNTPPTANAGPDQTVSGTTATLYGSGTDAEGPVTYAWTVVSGGATVTSPTALTTGVTGLTEGANVFRLTATDSGGLTHSDDVTITRNAAAIQLNPLGGFTATGGDREINITWTDTNS